MARLMKVYNKDHLKLLQRLPKYVIISDTGHLEISWWMLILISRLIEGLPARLQFMVLQPHGITKWGKYIQ